MLFVSFQVQTQTPWWRLLVRDIPHDAGALVAYVLIACFIGFIWLGNRKRSS